MMRFFVTHKEVQGIQWTWCMSSRHSIPRLPLGILPTTLDPCSPPTSTIPHIRTSACRKLTGCQGWRVVCLAHHLNLICCQNWPDMTVRLTSRWWAARRFCRGVTCFRLSTKPLEPSLQRPWASTVKAAAVLKSIFASRQFLILITLLQDFTYLLNLSTLPYSGLSVKLLTFLFVFLKRYAFTVFFSSISIKRSVENLYYMIPLHCV